MAIYDLRLNKKNWLLRFVTITERFIFFRFVPSAKNL